MTYEWPGAYLQFLLHVRDNIFDYGCRDYYSQKHMKDCKYAYGKTFCLLTIADYETWRGRNLFIRTYMKHRTFTTLRDVLFKKSAWQHFKNKSWPTWGFFWTYCVLLLEIIKVIILGNQTNIGIWKAMESNKNLTQPSQTIKFEKKFC